MAPRNNSHKKLADYGSLSSSETSPLQVSNDDSSGDEEEAFVSRTTRKKRCYNMVLLFLVAVVVVGISVSLILVTRDKNDIDDNNDNDPLLPLQASPIAMGLLSTERSEDASPSEIWGASRKTTPLPTNSWYLNLVSHRAASQPDESTRVYTVPYIVDTAPATGSTANNNADTIMAGIRVHWPVVSAGPTNVQMVDDWKNGISLGTKSLYSANYTVANHVPLSPLAVTLQWGGNSSDNKKKKMTSPIVRGMPYATMQYHGGVLPYLYSYNGPANETGSILADDEERELSCGIMGGSSSKEEEEEEATKTKKTHTVMSHLRLSFINSDFTWGVFFSQPVQVLCDVSDSDDPKTREFQLQVVSYGNMNKNTTKKDGDNKNDKDEEEPLTVRLALLDQCTTGMSNIQQHCAKDEGFQNQKEYEKLIQEAASIFPANPQINFTYNNNSNTGDGEESPPEKALMTIDWGAETAAKGSDDKKLIMFALPHHQETLDDSVVITDHCIPTFHGPTCLVQGDTWTLSEDLGLPMSFMARRPPEPASIPALAQALNHDIQYKLSDNMLRGAADTYFSGKILARLARVIVIASELKALAAGDDDLPMLPNVVEGTYDDVDDQSLALSMEAAAREDLPSHNDVAAAVEELQKGVEIWLTENAEAPYIYDSSWGGLVNCGCTYNGRGDTGFCNNTFPNCPALASVNEDFGNGYYNDHHYHYGYLVMAAAVVSKYDPVWAEKFFDRVLLFIRDFANPSPDDEYFTQFRQKDWFLGSSWASGIVSGENSPHGRNEESSSEAVAAYEAVTLYGSVMVDVLSRKPGNENKLETAKLIRNAGQLLTATELRATNRYWHVWSSDTHNNTYPAAYQQPVVGMLYDTMASFQTWFAPYPLVSYGIQLMPFTPVAEQRDDPEWAAVLYPLYDESCQKTGDFCIDNGWSILQAGLCATAGNRAEALKQALAVPVKVYSSDGGVGNSLSNTIWYISTRKDYAGISSNFSDSTSAHV